VAFIASSQAKATGRPVDAVERDETPGEAVIAMVGDYATTR